MNFGRAFGFFFEDEQWIKKILLGSLIALIPVVGQLAIMGYALAVLRNVRAGEARPLPDWSGFGSYLVDGLKFLVVTLVYAIPIIILACPLALVSVLPFATQRYQDLVAPLVGVAVVVGAGLACLVGLYVALLALLRPVLQIRYAETGEIGPCLRVGEVVRYFGRNFGPIFISLLVSFLVGGALTFVLGAISFGLLALPASVWMAAFSGHLFGQVARGAEAQPTTDSDERIISDE
jgi:hypothetical protein